MSYKHLFRLALSVAVFVPTTAFATTTLTIADTVAGIGTEANLSGFSGNAQVNVVVDSPSGQRATLKVATSEQGLGSVFIPGSFATEAGSYTASAVDLKSSAVFGRATFDVAADRVDVRRSSLKASATTLAIDGVSTVTIAVALRDAYGNPLAGRPVVLISSRARENITSIDRETNAQGVQRFSLKSNSPGTATIRAFDLLSALTLDQSVSIRVGDVRNGIGGIEDGNDMSDPGLYGYDSPYSPYGAQLIPTVSAQNFGSIDHFEVKLSPTSAKANEVLNLTIRAVDEQGNTVEDYTGEVTVSSPTDPDATLPGLTGTVRFTLTNLGYKVVPLSVAFRRSGQQTVLVEDRADPRGTVSGQATVSITAGSSEIPPNRLIEVTKPVKNGTVNSTQLFIEGKGPRYTNLTVRIIGGVLPAYDGDTDKDGRFAIPVELVEGQTNFVARVTDEGAHYDSGDVPFTLDMTAPTIENILFNPSNPSEGMSTLLSIKSEPKATATVKIAGQEFGMLESSTVPGQFQVSFTAPAPGNQQAMITVKDGAGNEATVMAPLSVKRKSLPKVEGLVGTPKNNAAELSWKALSDPSITAYRIYVGEDPQNLYTRDAPTNHVKLNGLKAGTLYYIAVTAVRFNQDGTEDESAERDPITLTPFGLLLKAESQDAAVKLDWLFPTADPVDTYLLEYGVTEGSYTEQRVLNGQLKTMIVRDLLNGVPYYFRLTPRLRDGTTPDEVNAVASATPGGDGTFKPITGDHVPGTIYDAPSNDLHQGAPNVPGSGLLSGMKLILMIGGAGLLFGLMQWRNAKRRKMTLNFLRAMEKQYRS